ncbi:MAG: UDP-N-acetylmuramate dehydrogenase [Candidatus Saccharimonadaceae bacterium]|nr:UDP-N-acetylmuramate dehydrogenase [Candidatus Saccharimonadaceae bacterium]
MNIQTNISFRDLTTMKLGGKTKYFTEINNLDELTEICRFADSKSLPIYVIGGGSNVIAKDAGYHGIVIRNAIKGFDVIDDNKTSTTIRVGAGENWDSVVKRAVNMDLSGIEAMSAIPGTAGATPVQNVGAYGQEISDTIQSLEAYDTKSKKMIILKKNDCNFSYRNSIFKGEFAGRYIITSITIKLSKSNPVPPFYDSLQKYLDIKKIKKYTPQTIRDAVIEIRKEKLPDPKNLPNCGSFFKNVIIGSKKFSEVKKIHPEIPAYNVGDGKYKISAGWLIENSGLIGKSLNGMRIYEKNAVVLTNESALSYDDLKKARDEIIKRVKEEFDIKIEQEPIEI